MVLAGRPGLRAWLYLRNQIINTSEDVGVAGREDRPQLEASLWLLPSAGVGGREIVCLRSGPVVTTTVTSSLSLSITTYKMGLDPAVVGHKMA